MFFFAVKLFNYDLSYKYCAFYFLQGNRVTPLVHFLRNIACLMMMLSQVLRRHHHHQIIMLSQDLYYHHQCNQT